MAILNTSTLEADARLIRWDGQPQDAGSKLTRGWPWLAGYTDTGTNSIRDLVTALTGTTITAPLANGRAYAGKFVVSENRAFDENEDGTEARDCKIVQTLTKVKELTAEEASLGTPDKNADRLTLNYLGFKEGQQFHIYYKYRNLDPEDYVTAQTMTITAPANYTEVKREFITEADKTGTLFVVFEDDNWLLSTDNGAIWNPTIPVDDSTDTKGRVRVSYSNYDESRNTAGHGFQEGYQLTGISKSKLDTNWEAARKSDTKDRVIVNVRRSERANGEYAIDQQQRIAFQRADTTGGGYHISRIRDARGTNPAAIERTWFRRTDTAKNALITPTTGAARKSVTYQGTVYYGQGVNITDHGDGTYTVTQTMVGGDTSYGAIQTFFSDSYPEVKVQTRSKDNKIRKIYYWKFVAAKPTEKSAKDFIATKAAASVSGGIVPGSDHIVKKAPFYYIATCKMPQRQDDPNTTKIKIDDWVAQ